MDDTGRKKGGWGDLDHNFGNTKDERLFTGVLLGSALTLGLIFIVLPAASFVGEIVPPWLGWVIAPITPTALILWALYGRWQNNRKRKNYFMKQSKLNNTQDRSPSVLAEEVYDQAVAIARKRGEISADILQRELDIGYARTVRVLDLMEQRGVVGPYEGNLVRQLL